MSSSDLPSELALSRYWNAARLPEDCRTTDGRRLDLIYRGHWSRGHGPDFRGAILTCDLTVWRLSGIVSGRRLLFGGTIPPL
ncbi:MAG: hypothetical protein M3P51_10395 [Chloroflexota bacterium]|nr:hypothetical protein [Chloroflexota bacterium]